MRGLQLQEGAARKPWAKGPCYVLMGCVRERAVSAIAIQGVLRDQAQNKSTDDLQHWPVTAGLPSHRACLCHVVYRETLAYYSLSLTVIMLESAGSCLVGTFMM